MLELKFKIKLHKKIKITLKKSTNTCGVKWKITIFPWTKAMDHISFPKYKYD